MNIFLRFIFFFEMFLVVEKVVDSRFVCVRCVVEKDLTVCDIVL